MKRFLLFAGEYYYPSGGWSDFRDDFDTADQAFRAADKLTYDWHHVVDTTTLHEVEREHSR